ncbi:MerR family transcriptional regulator [Allobranchiibius sp. CTAmp26]|uniref:MerR family transcriptional regulator n=1 Tax=Allobranchiibius sp. CTAmp26 TaxID=2815214 RepID=UPI0027DDDC48|nr:MerR family transcriptional regulator [Allobranchiibius sp. CTAmp26]
MSIAEAARLSGVSVHTLRYYERSGMMPTTPARTSGGTRRYRKAELEWIHTCTKLRSLGMSTDLIRRYVDLVRAGPGNEADRLHLLEAQRERVLAQQAQLSMDLEMINGKIQTYRERLEQGSADGIWSVPREP